MWRMFSSLCSDLSLYYLLNIQKKIVLLDQLGFADTLFIARYVVKHNEYKKLKQLNVRAQV